MKASWSWPSGPGWVSGAPFLHLLLLHVSHHLLGCVPCVLWVNICGLASRQLGQLQQHPLERAV